MANKLGKLGLFGDRSDGDFVAWYDEIDGEGAWVGQEMKTSLDDLRRRGDRARTKRTEDGWQEFEYVSVEIAAQEWVLANPDVRVERASCGYAFESTSGAKKFLVAMKAAQRAARDAYETGVEWPDWAKQAQAAGWKPPKGWKP